MSNFTSWLCLNLCKQYVQQVQTHTWWWWCEKHLLDYFLNPSYSLVWISETTLVLWSKGDFTMVSLVSRGLMTSETNWTLWNDGFIMFFSEFSNTSHAILRKVFINDVSALTTLMKHFILVTTMFVMQTVCNVTWVAHGLLCSHRVGMWL